MVDNEEEGQDRDEAGLSADVVSRPDGPTDPQPGAESLATPTAPLAYPRLAGIVEVGGNDEASMRLADARKASHQMPAPRRAELEAISCLASDGRHLEPTRLASTPDVHLPPACLAVPGQPTTHGGRSAGSTVDSDASCGRFDRMQARLAGLFPSKKESGSVRHTLSCALRHPLRPVIGQYEMVLDDKTTSLASLSQEGSQARLLPVDISRGSWLSREAEEEGCSKTLHGQAVGKYRTPGALKRRRSVLDKVQWGAASYQFSSDSSHSGHEENSPRLGLQLQFMAYVRPVSLIFIAIFDLLTAFIVQLFWPIEDFLCMNSENGSWSEGRVRTSIVLLIAIVDAFHAYIIILGLSETDSSDQLVILRFVRRWQAEHSASKLLANPAVLAVALARGLSKLGWRILIFCLSIGVLIVHTRQCDTFESAELASHNQSYLFVRRLHIVVHFARALGTLFECTGLRRDLEARIRAAVSLNKRRFICRATLVDLDLTYICDRLIAMAVPCVDGATMYRNNIREVARFFASRHYGHFMIFNLCEDFEEKGNGNYDRALLYGQVQKLPMHDHNAPSMHNLVSFCEQASAWLEQHKDNVVAVHCQGGKGRTGCFCAALALWTEFTHGAKASLDYFAQRRTDRSRGTKHVQGVAAPCQIRYVHYMEALLADSTIDCWSPPKVLLQTVTVQTMPLHTNESIYVMFVIESNGALEYDHFKEHGLVRMVRGNPAADEWSFDVQAVVLQGDVSVRFFVFQEDFTGPTSKDSHESRQPVMGKGARSIKVGRHIGKQLFFFSFHTAFHPGQLLTFGKREIDGAYNRHDDQFLPEFSVTLTFLKHTEALELHRNLESLNNVLGQPLKQTKSLSPSALESTVARAALHHYTNRCFARKMLARAYPETIKYKKGQVIWKDSALRGCNEVFYIVSGSCSFHAPDMKQCWQVNNTCMDGQPLREGSFIGILRFLLGPEADLDLPEVRAWTPEVVVRKLTLRRTPDGHVPLEIEGLSAEEVKVLYERMARDLWLQSQISQGMLRALLVTAHAKQDTMSESMPRAERQRQTKGLVNRFKIPSTEHLVEHVKSERVNPDAIQPGQSASQLDRPGALLKGSLNVLTSYIIFSGEASDEGDLLMPLKDVINAEMDGGLLSITVVFNELVAAVPDKEKNPGWKDQSVRIRDQSVLNARIGDQSVRNASPFHPATRRASMDALSDPSAKWHQRFPDVPVPSGISGFLASTEVGWAKLKELFVTSRIAGDDSDHPSIQSMSSRQVDHSGKSTVRRCDSGAGLDTDQGAVTTFVFRPLSAQAGIHLCETLKSRVVEASKVLSIKDLQRSNARARDDAEYEAGFGYVCPDDPEEEGGAGEVLQTICRVSLVLRFRQGEVIAYEGATEKHMHHVLSGKVFLLDNTTGTITKELVAGDTFGFELLLQTGNWGLAYRAIAAVDTEVLTLREKEIALLSSLKETRIGARIYRNIAILSALRAQSDLLILKAWRTMSDRV